MTPDLFEGVPLPRTVIEIDKTLEHAARRSCRRSDRFTSCDTALQGTGIDCRRMPFAVDALSKGGGLSHPFVGQGKFGLAPKPFGRDAIDMAMPGEQDFRHLVLLIVRQVLKRPASIGGQDAAG